MIYPFGQHRLWRTTAYEEEESGPSPWTVERGQATISDGDLDEVITLATPVEVGKAFAHVMCRGAAATDRTERILARPIFQTVVDGAYTELRLVRGSTTSDVDVVWQVVSCPDFTVQEINIALGSGVASNTAAITAVDLTKTFLVPGQRHDASVTPQHYMTRYRLSDDETLAASRQGTTAGVDATVYVVEDAYATVQEVTITMADGSSSDTETIPTTVDPDAAIVVPSYETNNASGRRGLVLTDMTDGDTLRVRTGISDTGLTRIVTAYVVERENFSVQRGDEQLPNGDGAETATLTAVTPANAWVVSNQFGNSGNTGNDDDNSTMCWNRLDSATALETERDGTSQLCVSAYQVVEAAAA